MGIKLIITVEIELEPGCENPEYVADELENEFHDACSRHRYVGDASLTHEIEED